LLSILDFLGLRTLHFTQILPEGFRWLSCGISAEVLPTGQVIEMVANHIKLIVSVLLKTKVPILVDTYHDLEL
jgi:hypothetical protein